MWKLIKTVILVILVLVAASEFILPTVVAKVMEQSLQNIIKADNITVKVDSQSAVLMLAGKFDKITITALNAQTDKLSFSEMHADLKDVVLDESPLLTQKTVSIKQVGEVNMSAVITQEELSAILSRSVKGIRDADVKITPSGVKTTGAFGLGFANVSVALDGKIVGDGKKIKLVTERFFVNNSPVGNIGGAVMTEIPLADLTKFPFGVSVRSISMEQGKAVIYADNRI